MASLNQARVRANIAKAKMELNQIKTAMEMFLSDNGELPPIGDSCPACGNPCNSSWTIVIDSLMAGNYLLARIDVDPWGNYYCYDDNYIVPACNYDTPLWSMGPNGNRDTSWGNGPPSIFVGDDFGTIIEPPHC
ncbi:MAG: type II secretion system protein GspG [Nanoarchaeota archaeon]